MQTVSQVYSRMTYKLKENSFIALQLSISKSLCAVKHINVYNKSKDASIRQLLEAESSCEDSVTEGQTTTGEMSLTMM